MARGEGSAEADAPLQAPPGSAVASPSGVELQPSPEVIDEGEGGGVLEEWWLWTLVGAVVVGASVAIAVVLTAGDTVEDPLVGSTGVVSRAIRW